MYIAPIQSGATCTLVAGGFATIITELTSNHGVAASQALGHGDPRVTLAHYIKPISQETMEAMKLLEERTANGRQ